MDTTVREKAPRRHVILMMATKPDCQSVLEAELERLNRILKLGYELKVRWVPNSNSRISGEVKGNCIYVYDEDVEVAQETLKHEFVDYEVSQAVEPYKEITNKLIVLVNDVAYRRKEQLVESLTRLLRRGETG